MKKLIFALLALFMVSTVVVSCDNKKSKKDEEEELTPAEQMIACMEDMVDVLKDTHIKSTDDVKDLKEKMDGIKKDFDEAQKALEEELKEMSDEERKEFEEKTEKQFEEKVYKLMEDLPKEMERLQKEATEANIDASEVAEVMERL